VYDFRSELRWYEKVNWLAVIGVTLVLSSILQLLINGVGIFTALAKMDETAEFKRGLLYGRTEAHQFILGRISPEMAGKFYEWIQSRKGSENR